jgi:NADH-ubiquinone oxidoreductase chain 2
LGLEINLISFITLILYNKKILSTESALIYFIVQAIASSILLYAILIFIFNNYFIFFLNIKFTNLILFSLLIKVGAAPIHFWLPIIIEGLNWINNYLTITWQKLAPIILLFYCSNNFLLFFFIITSAIIGTLKGFNQTSLKKLIAYSSINYTSWLLITLILNIILWKIYFLFYFYLSLCLILLFNIYNIFSINQLYFSNYKNYKVNYIFLLNILSIGGLPPFLGFFPKLITILFLIKFNNFFLLLILIIFNLIILYYYLRIRYSTFLLNFIKNKSNYNFYINKNKKNINYLLKYLIIFSYFTNFFLLIFTLIFFIII